MVCATVCKREEASVACVCLCCKICVRYWSACRTASGAQLRESAGKANAMVALPGQTSASGMTAEAMPMLRPIAVPTG
jgi:hypothetical protein